MGQRRKPRVTDESDVEQDLRNQEVLRANRDLAAYFKGRRTEREARAALKIIKAFVRDRGSRDARSRPPLPGLVTARTPKAISKAPPDTGGRRTRTPPRTRQVHTEPSALPDTDERTPE